jgi:hypothetical protein
MSVHQTRAYFKDKYGNVVDNPEVCPAITKVYWDEGNSRPFLELVKGLTGKDLSGEDWVAALNESLDDKVACEKKEYEGALNTAPGASIDDIGSQHDSQVYGWRRSDC